VSLSGRSCNPLYSLLARRLPPVQGQIWIAKRKSEQQQFIKESMCILLTKALKYLPSVRGIKLEAEVVTRFDRRAGVQFGPLTAWSVQWPLAFQTYEQLLTAITFSGVHIDNFSIFKSSWKSSIPTHEITMPLVRRLETDGLAAVSTQLKGYTMSLAMTAPTSKLEPEENIPEEMGYPGTQSPTSYNELSNAKADFEGVSSLLRLMPNLELLDVKLYPAVMSLDLEAGYDSFLPTLLQDNWYLPRLRELRLLGVLATQEALQEFILRHAATLQVLSLENVVLISGSWEPIFATLSQQTTSLTSLRLSLLGVGEHRIGVNLEPVDRDLDDKDESIRHGVYNLGRDLNFWHERCIEEDEIRKGLRFRPVHGYISLNPAGLSFYESFHMSYTLLCRCCM